mmetsp:Transcript_28742/g.66321  ORF Transcript_28742/g.66321 Transcript_28742/m.66321 type:complete len:428 (-) Transcript_28742:655-1938(-)
MIQYENGLAVLFKLHGSVFPRAIPYAIVSALIAAFVAIWYHDEMNEIFAHPYAHQVFSISVGFVLVFRANLSYQRFWEGRTQLQQMSSKWSECVLQIYCFDRCTSDTLDDEDDDEFCKLQIHLFSLLHAVSLQDLRADKNLTNIVEYGTKEAEDRSQRERVDQTGNSKFLAVCGAMDDREQGVLTASEDRVYAVMTWITHDWVVRARKGGLGIPPPILSRAYQCLSDGHQAFMQARKIHDTPFPFPYAQLVSVLLIVFMFTAPIVVAAYVDDVALAVFLSFFSTCSSVALDEVAKEIEDPFGFDPNDLPLTQLHEGYNERVMQLTQQVKERRQWLQRCRFAWYSKPVKAPAAPAAPPAPAPAPAAPAASVPVQPYLPVASAHGLNSRDKARGSPPTPIGSSRLPTGANGARHPFGGQGRTDFEGTSL